MCVCAPQHSSASKSINHKLLKWWLLCYALSLTLPPPITYIVKHLVLHGYTAKHPHRDRIACVRWYIHVTQFGAHLRCLYAIKFDLIFVTDAIAMAWDWWRSHVRRHFTSTDTHTRRHIKQFVFSRSKALCNPNLTVTSDDNNNNNRKNMFNKGNCYT